MTACKQIIGRPALFFLALLLFAPAMQRHGLFAQDDKPKETESRERRGRDRKARENESLNRGNDKVVDRDEKLRGKEDSVTDRDERLSRDETKNRSNEKLTGKDDTLGRDEKTKGADELRRDQQANRLRENNERGKAWEEKTANYMEARNGERPREQVTLEGNSGTRSRPDMIYEDPNARGRYILVECKASDKADFTANQREVFGSIREGDEVTVRGKNMGPEFDGQKVKISEIYVARPDNNGDVRTERYQDTRGSDSGAVEGVKNQ